MSTMVAESLNCSPGRGVYLEWPLLKLNFAEETKDTQALHPQLSSPWANIPSHFSKCAVTLYLYLLWDRGIKYCPGDHSPTLLTSVTPSTPSQVKTAPAPYSSLLLHSSSSAWLSCLTSFHFGPTISEIRFCPRTLMAVFLGSQMAVTELVIYFKMSKASKEKHKNNRCGGRHAESNSTSPLYAT